MYIVLSQLWALDGPAERTERHVGAQLAGDGRSNSWLGLLDGRPMSYWDVYRADLDPLARHYPAEPHDTGIHLPLGPPEARGHGLGSILLTALADHLLKYAPRLVGERGGCRDGTGLVPRLAAATVQPAA
ncbi:GNAT family N-acetyltransferase [Streptomyces griseofuscus]|uniref:GNAT family N-acetyltransferase n=1 Tax=Streptomyces griseofuscus TaxID=146922 RepID=UPI002689FD03